MSGLIDITVAIRDGMVHYDGNPGVHLELAQSIAAGDGANVTRLDLGAHFGTHIDAPLHFFEGGAGAETLPIEPLLGPAHVVDATSVEKVLDEVALRSLDLPDGAERVLFKTRNSKLWASDEFTRDFVRLDGSGARYLIDRGVRLVGIDYLSIGDHDAHVALLGGGIVALEGLDLGAVEPGSYPADLPAAQDRRLRRRPGTGAAGAGIGGLLANGHGWRVTRRCRGSGRQQAPGHRQIRPPLRILSRFPPLRQLGSL